MSVPSPPTTWVLVPVKAFAEAKLRLAPAVGPDERRRLAQAMAEHVGARAIPEPGRGLNNAVTAGVARLAAAGADRVIVAHADLPLAGPLAWTAAFAGVTLVPDHRDDGTNVICVPAGTGFGFSYGPGSFHRHGREALRLGLGLRVVREPLLGHDVDVPDDLVSLPVGCT